MAERLGHVRISAGEPTMHLFLLEPDGTGLGLVIGLCEPPLPSPIPALNAFPMGVSLKQEKPPA